MTAARPVRSGSDGTPGRLLGAAGLLFLAGVFTLGLWILASSAAALGFRADGPFVAALPAYVVLSFVAAFLLAGQGHVVGLATAVVGMVIGLVLLPFGVVLLVLCGVAAGLIGSVERGEAGPSRSTWLALGGFAVGSLVLAAMDGDPLRPADTRTPEVAGIITDMASDGVVLRLADGSERRVRGTSHGTADVGDLVLAGSSPGAWYVSIDATSDPDCYQVRTIGVDDRSHVVVKLPGSTDVALRLPKAPGFDPGDVRDGRYVGRFDGGSRVAAVAPGGRPEPGAAAFPALAGYFCLDAEGRAQSWNR